MAGLEGEISAKTDVVWFSTILTRRRHYNRGESELVFNLSRRARRTKE
jgi:hypothetical protein